VWVFGELSSRRLARGASTTVPAQFVVAFAQKLDAEVRQGHVIDIYFEAAVGNFQMVLRDNLQRTQDV
jgi:uncharacterized protein (AIM24 family)